MRPLAAAVSGVEQQKIKKTKKGKKNDADGEAEEVKQPRATRHSNAWHLERVYDEDRGEVVEVALCATCFGALPQRERLALTRRQLVAIVRSNFAARRNLAERWHAVRDFLDSGAGVGLVGLLQ